MCNHVCTQTQHQSIIWLFLRYSINSYHCYTGHQSLFTIFAGLPLLTLLDSSAFSLFSLLSTTSLRSSSTSSSGHQTSIRIGHLLLPYVRRVCTSLTCYFPFFTKLSDQPRFLVIKIAITIRQAVGCRRLKNEVASTTATKDLRTMGLQLETRIQDLLNKKQKKLSLEHNISHSSFNMVWEHEWGPCLKGPCVWFYCITGRDQKQRAS